MIEFEIDGQKFSASPFSAAKSMALFESRLVERSRKEIDKIADLTTKQLALVDWRTQLYQGAFREGGIQFVAAFLSPQGIAEAIYCCVRSVSPTYTEDLHRRVLESSSLAEILAPLVADYAANITLPRPW